MCDESTLQQMPEQRHPIKILSLIFQSRLQCRTHHDTKCKMFPMYKERGCVDVWYNPILKN